MNWVALALSGLKIVLWFLDRAKENKQFNAGHDAAVFEASKELMNQTSKGKKISEIVDALDDKGLDDLLASLAALSGIDAPRQK